MEKLQAIGATVTGLKKKLSEAAKSRNKAAAIAGQVPAAASWTGSSRALGVRLSAERRKQSQYRALAQYVIEFLVVYPRRIRICACC